MFEADRFWYREFQRSRFFVLLIALLALILATPAVDHLEDRGLAALIFRLMFTALLLVAIYSTATHRTYVIAACVLAAVWVTVGWWAVFTGSRTGDVLGGILLIAFLTLVNMNALARLVRVDSANFDLLCAATVIYILLAIGWAVSYSTIYTYDPGAIVASDGRALQWSDHMYFSLTTLTTLGYGDISPARPFVRIWATLEAVTGVLYMALLVARLVAIYRPTDPRRK